MHSSVIRDEKKLLSEIFRCVDIIRFDKMIISLNRDKYNYT